MTRAVLLAAVVVCAALLTAPAAPAATAGTYAGSLFQSGERVRGSNVRLVVLEGGDRFTLRARRMRLTCPFPDDDGSGAATVRLRLVHRGDVDGDRIDDTRILEGGNNQVRVTGEFTGRRFAGRIRVSGAPGVTGACSGTARVRANR